ncbi:MAG: hypothetical protein N3D84_00585 [Candidatus Woesearchaeota archaeon]|nr:hypothetical protein [Candidatus Woesearchaeota archaeon]
MVMEYIITDTPTMIGVFGFAFLLVAYILALFGKLKLNSLPFDLLNIIGALLLFYYTYKEGALIFSALVLVWAIIAVINMSKLIIRK